MKRLLMVGCAALTASAFAEGEITFLGIQNSNTPAQTYSACHVYSSGQDITKFGMSWFSAGDPAAPADPDYLSCLSIGSFWSDDEDPSSDKTYLVNGPRGFVLPCGVKDAVQVFNGKKLIFGQLTDTERRYPSGSYSSGSLMAGYLMPRAGTIKFANDGVDLVYGGFIARNAALNATLSGTFNVLSPAAMPWYFDNSWAGNTAWTFDAESKFVADEGTAMKIKGTDSKDVTTTLKFLGDMSEYEGLLDVGYHDRVVLGNTVSFPGTIRLSGADTKLTVGDSTSLLSASVGTIDFAAAGTLSLATGKIPTTADGVTMLKIGAITKAEGVEIAKPKLTYGAEEYFTQLSSDIYAYGAYNNDNPFRTVTILEVPEASCDKISDLVDVVYSYGDKYDNRWVWTTVPFSFARPYETVENGKRRLKADFPKIKSLKYKPNGNVNIFDPAKVGDYWYGCEAGDSFAADTAYIIQGERNAGFGDAALNFPGYAFAQAWSSVMRLNNDLTIPAYCLFPNAGLVCQCAEKGRTRNTIRGKMFIHISPTQGSYEDPDNIYWPSYATYICGDGELEIAADISGDGTISLKHAYTAWGFKKAPFALILSGDNSGYKGRFLVGGPTAEYPAELRVSAANQLGLGTVGHNTYSAIQISANGQLTATDSFEISEPSHGVYVTGGGKIGVAAGKRLSLRTQLTLGSNLVKTGAGTLALGGPLRFSSAQLDEPVTDMDIVEVREGALRGLNNGAADGLQIKLFPGAALEIASPTEAVSADENAYGLYNVMGWINCGEAEGVLNVRLSEEGRYDADGNDLWPDTFARPICTVNNYEAGGLEGCIQLVARPRGVKLTSIETVANADGETTTFVAHFKRSGFAILVR